jgi:hypothetical protein
MMMILIPNCAANEKDIIAKKKLLALNVPYCWHPQDYNKVYEESEREQRGNYK